MGSRYVISGVQLGMFTAFSKHSDSEGAEKLMNEIINDQWYKDSTADIKEDVEILKSFYDQK